LQVYYTFSLFYTNIVSKNIKAEICQEFEDYFKNNPLAKILKNYLNTIQTPNTFENRNIICYNLRISPRIFLAKNLQKNKNIKPVPEKKKQ